MATKTKTAKPAPQAVEPKPEAGVAVAEKPEAPQAPAPVKAEPMSDAQRRIAESRMVLKTKLEAGMKFFEAPDGYIMVGEAERDQLWCRSMNGGKGGWINPMR